jgi:hypothetical protein
MKKVLILLIFSFLSVLSQAQVYVRSFGVRLDESAIGLSVVQRLFKYGTVEGLVEFRQKDVSAALVPRIHTRILGRRLNAFFGLGPHAGWVKVDASRLNPYWGLGAMFGLEYKFNLIPVHISYDIRPLVQLDGHPDLFGIQSAFAIRIVKRKERKAWKEKVRKWKEDTKDWLDGED